MFPVCSSAANHARSGSAHRFSVRHPGHGPSSTGSTAAANTSCTTSQETRRAGRLRPGDSPLGYLKRGLLAQPGRDPAPRRQGGTCSVDVLRGRSGLPRLRRTLTHRRSTRSAARRTSPGRASTVSCTQPETVPQSGHAAAAGSSVTAHTSTHPVQPGLHVGDPQALHPEQRRRRILEHDARGFLVILKSVAGPKIVGAAGSQNTATRP